MKAITDAGVIEIGTTEAAPTIGLTDYSRRETDDFGVTTVVKRGFSRTMSVRVMVPTANVDALQRQLAALRAKPVQWVADDRFDSLSITGFYKDLSIDLAIPPVSYCTLTIEGLAEGADYADPGTDPATDQRKSTLRLLRPASIDDAVLTSSNVPENDYPAWSASATYALGARVILSATHRIYESAANGNVGNDPTGAAGQWIDIGPTNRWAMFDQALGSQTERAGSIVVSLDPVDPIDAVALLDVTAVSVRVQAPGYDRTLSPAIQSGAVTFLDLPATAGAVVITISGSGTVSAGTLLIGKLLGLGTTEASPTAAITDYSRKETDAFGEVTVVERAWAKRMDVKSLISTAAVDVVAARIANVRAMPALWIGDATLESLAVYGFFKDFSIALDEHVSTLSLSIEGLSTAAKLAPLGADVSWSDIKDDDPAHPKPEDGATVGATPEQVEQIADAQFTADAAAVAVAAAQAQIAAIQSSVSADLSSLNAEVDALQNEAGEMQNSIAALQSADSAIQQSVGLLQNDMASAQGSIGAINSEIDALTNGVGSLSTTVSQLSDETDALQVQAAGIVSSVSSLADQITSLGGDVNTIESTLSSQGASISSLQTTVSNQAGTLAQHTADIATANASISTNAQAITGLNGSLASLSSTVSTQGGQISGLQSVTTTLQGTVSTLQTQIRAGGGNLLVNTDAATGLDGWDRGSNGGPAGVEFGRNAPDASWHPASENVFSIHQPDGTSSGYSEFAQYVAVTGGKYYDFSLLWGAHRCQAELIAQWENGSGGVLGYSTLGQQGPAGGGPNLGSFMSTSFNTQAPSDAVRVRFYMRKYATLAGQSDSWAWFLRPQVAESVAGAASPVAYSPGSNRAAIVVNAEAISTANGQIASLSSTLSAQGASISTLQQVQSSHSGTIAQHSSDIAAANANISTNAQAISTANGNIASLTTRVSSAESSVSTNASAITGLTGRTASLESSVSAQGASISTLQTASSTQAGQLSTLENRLVAGNPNLLPNGGFENGFAGWDSSAGWGIGSGGVWGNYAYHGSNGTMVLSSAPIAVAPNYPYTVSADFDFYAASGVAYVDMVFMDSAGNVVLDGPQAPVPPGTSFRGDGLNRKTYQAQNIMAPSNAAKVIVRCVTQNVSGLIGAAFRQVKLEAGGGATAYSSEASVVQQFTALNTLTSSYAAIETRVSSAEGSVSTLQSSMTSANGSISTLQSNVSSLQGSVSTLQSTSSTQAGQISALQSTVSTQGGQISTNASAITTLTGSLSTLSNVVSASSSPNLVKNGGFENRLSGWASSGLSFNHGGGGGYWGFYAQVQDLSGGYALIESEEISVPGNNPFVLSMDFDIYGGGGCSGYASITWFKADHSFASTPEVAGGQKFAPKSFDNSGASRSVLQVNAPADAAYARVRAVFHAPSGQTITSGAVRQIKFEMSAIATPYSGEATAGQMFQAYSDLNGSFASLSTTVSSQGGSISTLQSSFTSLNGTVSTLSSTVSSQGASISSLQTASSTQGGQISTLQSTVSTQGGSINTLQSSVSTLQSTVSTLETTLSTQGGQISNLQSVTSTLQGSVATLQTQIRAGGGNLLVNTDAAIGLEGWQWGSNGGPAGVEFGRNAPDASWHPASENVFSIHQPDGTSSGYSEFAQYVAVTGGKYYDFSLLWGAHRCQVELIAQWENGSGGVLGYSTLGVQGPAGGGPNLGNFMSTSFNTQAPSDAVRVRFYMRKYATLAGQSDSWAWFLRPQVAESVAGAASPVAYSPGSNRAVIALQAEALSTLNTQYASVSSTVATQGASISSQATAITNLQGNYASLSSTVSTLNASVATQQSAITDLQGRTSAYWQVTAVAGGRAQLRVYADSNGGGGVDVVGDLRVTGNALIDGTVNPEALALQRFVKRLGPTSISATNTIGSLYSGTLGQTLANGSYLLEGTVGFTYTCGRQTSTYNGKPYYIDYLNDGGVLVRLYKNGTLIASTGWSGPTQTSYGSMAYGSAMTTNFDAPAADTLTGDVTIEVISFKGSVDTGIVNQGDYYTRQISGSYSNFSFSNLKLKWTFI